MPDPLDSVSVDDLQPQTPPEDAPRGEAGVDPGAPPGDGEPSSPLPSPGDISTEEVWLASFLAAFDLASAVTGLESVAATGDPQAEQAGRAAYRICLRNPALHWLLRDTAWMIDYGILAMFGFSKFRAAKAEIDARRERAEPPRPAAPGHAAPEADIPRPGDTVIDGRAVNAELPEAA